MENIQISETLKAHFLRLFQIAICDDEFSALEIKMLYRFAEDRGIPTKNLDELLLNPINTTKQVPESLEEKIDYLYDLSAIIWADEKISDSERDALEKYIKIFGFVDENIPQIAEYLLESIQTGKSKSDIINDLKN